MKHLLHFCVLLSAIFACAGCGSRTTQTSNSAVDTTSSTRRNTVVVYCSVDDVYARPILRALEQRTGLTIRPLFDAEAAKTAGLAARIRAEKNSPRADVFWSSAALQTLLLSREGLLEKDAQRKPNAEKPWWRGSDWIATGVRARVIVYHASVKPPRVLDDLLMPRFKGKIGISNALFGTGSDWAAALAARNGTQDTLNYFRRLKLNGAKILPGNSVVAERVGRGELLAGVTDTDDFLALQKQFPNLKISLTKTAKTPSDFIFIPMTAAILKGAPHINNARKLMDALSSPEIEALIVTNMPGVLPIRGAWNDVPPSIATLKTDLAKSRDDTAQWPTQWQKIRDPLAEILLRD